MTDILSGIIGQGVMAKRKREHYAELMSFDNVLKNPPEMRGKWRESVFKNMRPVVAELACGKAEYALALARRFPENNYIGVDKKGARLWSGAKTAIEENITNLFFLMILIQEITDYFAEKEVDELFITFPDPYPKSRHAKHRLTSINFLEKYRKILKRGASIHLKTDDAVLYEYSINQIMEFGGNIHESIDDIYSLQQIDEIITFKTTYEKRHLALGRRIRYLRFTLS
ncbi:tRNA (guanosine(46)-N7)-methyltransferase TrmB [candidate division KSB1 bacterium]|nr:tRNA (guanosine(46)-N7)-methyltransferase TrmB [candidate division KSB1 bacterium]